MKLYTMHMKKLLIALLFFTSIAYGQQQRGGPVETTPSMATATSVSVLSANPYRKYLLIQNNSAANICCSLSGNTLTGIAPTSTNKCFVLLPTASYENSSSYVSTTAITCYQTSGGTINTVYVAEG